MKKCYGFVLLLCLVSLYVVGQPLIMKGRIKCLNPSPASTKGAENILVVPAFLPVKSVVTASQPSGYFEFNTGVSVEKLRDKQVSIYVVSRCATCKEGVKRVFISEDQDRRNRDDNKAYYTIKDWTLKTSCTQAELNAMRADSFLQVIAKQPAQDIDKISTSTALMGTPAFLNLLTNIVTAASILPNAGQFEAQTIYPGKTTFGEFLWASPLSHSANTGFNFSPSRDVSEAVFWNPSAIAASRKQNNVSLLTNLKNNVKLGGFTRLTNKISLGAGGIYTSQDEFRQIGFYRVGTPRDTFLDSIISDSFNIKLKEFAAFLTPVYQVNDRLSVGLTLKSIWQQFNNPDSLYISNDGQGTFFDAAIRQQRFDVDFSITYKVSPSFQVGLNAMNLAGSELYADAFVPWKAIAMQNQRSFGLGLTYKYRRWNIGTDLLFAQDDFYDASIGVNYVPFNNATIAAGFAIKQLSYSLSFRMKHFRLAYINDNDFLFTEARLGKSKIFNGNIYGGFVFDFD